FDSLCLQIRCNRIRCYYRRHFSSHVFYSISKSLPSHAPSTARPKPSLRSVSVSLTQLNQVFSTHSSRLSLSPSSSRKRTAPDGTSLRVGFGSPQIVLPFLILTFSKFQPETT